ncbi:hypothetical protein X777_13876 [Ooceraea biroi]|uniref:Uncharacterized protein n=1 Tax=Ooceraea biroi TaxID=2015173 RepID=A0A026VY09_OOCBI|nr:hypothetical protein X777_13876 [Ooceraea biroi]
MNSKSHAGLITKKTTIASIRNQNEQLHENRMSKDIRPPPGWWRTAAGKERNNESPCQESALFIDNKASERATRRCDKGKYSASISVRGCLSILDEYKVPRFRPPPSPSRRNKFALARVKRGESTRGVQAGGRTGAGEGRSERVRRRSRRAGGKAGGKKKEKEEHERKWKRRTGRGPPPPLLPPPSPLPSPPPSPSRSEEEEATEMEVELEEEELEPMYPRMQSVCSEAGHILTDTYRR